METYCYQCNTIVAPHDPNKIKWGNKLFHEKCFKQMKQSANMRNEDVALIWRGEDAKIAYVPRR